MKLSENWLREWVNPNLDSSQLASVLTMAGLEVDAISAVAGEFTKVIVAEVIDTKPHPEADKLTICSINRGQPELLQVVCGAANVRKGLKVALAEVGAHLPGNINIKEAKLRGQLSQGMLCSAAELGLADKSEGILELEADAPIGVDLRVYLKLDDKILDIDLTPNRADCLSIMGVARELAALTQISMKSSTISKVKQELDEQQSIKIEAKAACPRYVGRIIRDVNSEAKIPVWMKEHLRRSGIRSIHPIVDITNYVMLELGQPMHAFDLNKISGDIRVRFAEKSETLELLDGQNVELKPAVLVIADSEKPLGLAGIMGGKDSACTESTENIFLEAAYFEPEAISGVARLFGLHTDSSQRFERGIDPNIATQAIERASALILELAGGKAAPLSELPVNYSPQATTIEFNPSKVKQLVGLDIPVDFMRNTLQNLGLSLKEKDASWTVTVPSYRRDLSLDVDLVEEILRLYGYDKIPGLELKTSMCSGSINNIDALARDISNFLIARGYNETISYSFVDPKLQELLFPAKEKVKLLNPISPELSQMRLSLWPGLLASAMYNTHRQQSSLKLFETGVIFENKSSLVNEIPCFAGILMGEYGGLNWGEQQRSFDFFDLKGDLQALLSSLNLSKLSFEATTHTALHPGKAAVIKQGQDILGYCGVLHPRIADILELTEDAILFEFALDKLLTRSSLSYKPISKFPQIRRDLSLLVDEDLPVIKIKELIQSIIPAERLKSFDIFDLYRGQGLPQGKKSLALALTLQDISRTLTDNEINELINAIIRRLQDELNIRLRE